VCAPECACDLVRIVGGHTRGDDAMVRVRAVRVAVAPSDEILHRRILVRCRLLQVQEVRAREIRAMHTRAAVSGARSRRW
jgi:hypothetical protein